MVISKLLSLEVSSSCILALLLPYAAEFILFFALLIFINRSNYIGFLEQIRRATSEIITKIRSHTDAIENQRRILEEKKRKERANKIQTEVITSHKKNVEIDWTW